MQDLQAHLGVEGDGGGGGEEEGERHIWHVSFADGGFMKVQDLQVHDDDIEMMMLS